MKNRRFKNERSEWVWELKKTVKYYFDKYDVTPVLTDRNDATNANMRPMWKHLVASCGHGRRATEITLGVDWKCSIISSYTCILWGFAGWAHHWDGPKGPQIPLEFNPWHNQDWTLCGADVTQVRNLRLACSRIKLENLSVVGTYFHIFFTIIYVMYYFMLSSAAWRSVKRCAPDWALWWMAGSNAWAASSTSRTGQEDKDTPYF